MSINNKRKNFNGKQKTSNPKRFRINNYENPHPSNIPSDLRIKKSIFHVIISSNYDSYVYLNNECQYVKIGDLYFASKKIDASWNICPVVDVNNVIVINNFHYELLKKYIFDNKLFVSLLNSHDVSHIGNLDTVTVKIFNHNYYNNYDSNDDDENSDNDDDTNVNKKMIRREELSGKLGYCMLSHIVTLDQRFYIECENNNFYVDICDIGDKLYGKMTFTTNIKIIMCDENIVLYDDIIDIRPNNISLEIIACRDTIL